MTTVNILLLSQMSAASGNFISAQRILSFFREKRSYKIHAIDVTDLSAEATIENLLREHKIDVAIGIHAYRSGRFLLRAEIPKILVVGGTDINEMASLESDEDTRPERPKLNTADDDESLSPHPAKIIVKQALLGSRFVIVFHEAMKRRVLSLIPSLGENIVIIPPTSMLLRNGHLSEFPKSSSREGRVKELLSMIRQKCFTGTEAMPHARPFRFFLLPCGLRPVKDPLFLISAYSDHFLQNKAFPFLLIVGSPLADNEEYGRKVLEEIASHDGILHCDPFSHDDFLLLTSLDQCVGCVNTSISEGLSNALLEAMSLGKPTLVRRNEGNIALVSQERGFIFESANEFLRIAESVSSSSFVAAAAAAGPQQTCEHSEPDVFVDDLNSLQSCGTCVSRLIHKKCELGRVFVQRYHSFEQEREAFENVVEQCLHGGR